MNTKTITVTMSESYLRHLAAIAMRLANAVDAQATRTPFDNGGGHSIRYPDSASVDVRGLDVGGLQSAARDALVAIDYTNHCEAELREKLADRVDLPAKSAAGLNIYTRAQIVASYSVHGSFGEDHVVRQAEDTAKREMQFVHIGSDRGYSGYDGRAYSIKSGIFCG